MGGAAQEEIVVICTRRPRRRMCVGWEEKRKKAIELLSSSYMQYYCPYSTYSFSNSPVLFYCPQLSFSSNNFIHCSSFQSLRSLCKLSVSPWSLHFCYLLLPMALSLFERVHNLAVLKFYLLYNRTTWVWIVVVKCPITKNKSGFFSDLQTVNSFCFIPLILSPSLPRACV